MLGRILVFSSVLSVLGFVHAQAQAPSDCDGVARAAAKMKFSLCTQLSDDDPRRNQACEQGIQAYSDLALVCQNTAVAYYMRGKLNLELLKFDLALSDAENAREIGSSDLSPLTLNALRDEILGRRKLHKAISIMKSSGSEREIERLVDEALTLGVGSEQELALRLRVNVLMKLGKWQQALDQMNDVMKFVASLDSNLWKVRGDILFELGRYEEAQSDYSIALQNGLEASDEIEALENRARIRANALDHASAIEDLTTIIAKHPTPGAHYYRAEQRYKQGALEPALEDISEAIRLSDHSEPANIAHIYRLKALILRATDDFYGALEAYDQSIAANPIPATRLERGDYLRDGNFLEEALRDYDDVIADDSAAHDEWGYAHLKRALILHEWQDVQNGLLSYRAFFQNASAGESAQLKAFAGKIISRLTSLNYYDGDAVAWDEEIVTALTDCILAPSCKF